MGIGPGRFLLRRNGNGWQEERAIVAAHARMALHDLKEEK
jgi:hypothetical protein